VITLNSIKEVIVRLRASEIISEEEVPFDMEGKC